MTLFLVSGVCGYGPHGESIIPGLCWEKTDTRERALVYSFHVSVSTGASCIDEAHPEEKVTLFI